MPSIMWTRLLAANAYTNPDGRYNRTQLAPGGPTLMISRESPAGTNRQRRRSWTRLRDIRDHHPRLCADIRPGYLPPLLRRKTLIRTSHKGSMADLTFGGGRPHFLNSAARLISQAICKVHPQGRSFRRILSGRRFPGTSCNKYFFN